MESIREGLTKEYIILLHQLLSIKMSFIEGIKVDISYKHNMWDNILQEKAIKFDLYKKYPNKIVREIA